MLVLIVGLITKLNSVTTLQQMPFPTELQTWFMFYQLMTQFAHLSNVLNRTVQIRKEQIQIKGDILVNTSFKCLYTKRRHQNKRWIMDGQMDEQMDGWIDKYNKCSRP